MISEKELGNFGRLICAIAAGKTMTREESKEAYRQVILNEQPELQQGDFLAALVSKGETPEEIVGAWKAIVEHDTVKLSNNYDNPIVENSGTGMDQIKTFNVSSAAAIVAAAGGVCIARHGARALTSVCGSVDILESIGIDVECNVDVVEKSIQNTGIGLFNGMSSKIHLKALFRIVSQIRFGSTLNVAASLASPLKATHALRGVYSEAIIPHVSKVMQEIGYYTLSYLLNTQMR